MAATEGVGAFNQQRWAEAADLFTRAESLVHSPVHVLFLARAQAKLGQLVKARENYNKILREKLAADAPEAFRKAQASAQEEVQAIEPRIAAIVVKLAGASARQVKVTMDGEDVPAALIGLPRPVDPGRHEFKASGDGFIAEPRVVSVADGGRAELVLTVKADPSAKAPAAAAPMAAAATQGAPGAPGEATKDAGAGGGAHKSLAVPAYIAFGVGAVGLGVGTVFFLQSKSSRSKADDLCPGGNCPIAQQPAITKYDNDADKAQTLAIVGFAVGGVGVATGVTLLLLSGSSSSKAAEAPRVMPWIGLNSAGVAGRF